MIRPGKGYGLRINRFKGPGDDYDTAMVRMYHGLGEVPLNQRRLNLLSSSSLESFMIVGREWGQLKGSSV